MNSDNSRGDFKISGNNLIRVGNTVIKQYMNNPDGYRTELFCLEALKSLKVPKVLDSTYSTELQLGYIEGENGRDAIEGGNAKEVLFEMGLFLKELQQVDTSIVAGRLQGTGTVICHGDFAHYNAIISLEHPGLLAIVDWEASVIGDPVLDVAWCEFQFLRQFPNQKWALQYLFKGFGSTPGSDLRNKAVQDRLTELQKINFNR